MPNNPYVGVYNVDPSTIVGRLNMEVGGSDDAKFNTDGVAQVRPLMNGAPTQMMWAYLTGEGSCNVEMKCARMTDFVSVTLLVGVPYRLDVIEVRRTNTDAEYFVFGN